MTTPPSRPDNDFVDATDAALPGASVTSATPAVPVTPATEPAATRKRPKPGERRAQILRTLAAMLEQPGADRITTAGLAAMLGVSEAALYRHFASKAQMFEALIGFIEHSVFTLISQVVEREMDPSAQARRVLTVLLQFAESNPGMARVMVGDALVFENERLLIRINQFFDQIELRLCQCLRSATEAKGAAAPRVDDANIQASVSMAFAVGRLQRFTRSGFKRSPTEHLDIALRLLVG